MKASPSSELSILIVDDSPFMRQTIRRAVCQAGAAEHRVVEAGDGQEALDMVVSGGVGLVLLDLNMPVLDGLGFLQAVRSRPESKRLPVIVVSTESCEDRLAAIRGLAILGFLRKPFAPDDLRVLVGPFLES